jgi:molecular chaperone HscB
MDPFATLGLPPRYHVDKDALDRRYRELQQALHPDRHASAPASERALTLHKAIEVNEAYRVLRDDQKRGEALLASLGGRISGQAADPELLMEMMELREGLSEARAQRDAAQVARLAASSRRSSTSYRASQPPETPRWSAHRHFWGVYVTTAASRTKWRSSRTRRSPRARELSAWR